MSGGIEKYSCLSRTFSLDRMFVSLFDVRGMRKSEA